MTTNKANKPKQRPDQIEVEPGAEKRLANILKKALNTPPARKLEASKPERSIKKG